MPWRSAVLLLLLVFAPVSAPIFGQASKSSIANSATTPADPTNSSNADQAPAATQPPQIIVNPPAPVAPPWTWRERVAWGANIVLAVLGYAGIMLFLSMLKKIERHTEAGAAAAQAALDTAQTALTQTQAIVNSERPWIVVRVEPSLTKENTFRLMATNRGRSPARIVSLVDQVQIAVDETNLPAAPEYENTKPAARPEPIVLLPSESVAIKTFSRDDVRGICKTTEEFERIELWEKNIFLYGRVSYRDMLVSSEKPAHETDWCYWYIHGDKKSALSIAGTPEYNKHS
jgi:hypothetical protein